MEQISADNAFKAVEFAENPEPRVPCVLIVDTSTSMQGPRIDELNKGLQVYRDELLADPLASKRVEVAIVTFGGRGDAAGRVRHGHELRAAHAAVIGGTPMGEAINIALDMIEERKSQLPRARHRLLPAVGVSDHRRRAERPLEAGRLARARRREAEVVLLLRRGRRRRQHAGARGDLRSQAALAAGHEVPRAVQLALEFAAGGVALVAGRRSAARGSDDRPAGWAAV